MAQLRFPYINSIILSGRLVNDSSIKVIPTSGKQVLEFRIATNRRYILNGENREETLYINCIYMGQRVNEYSEILKTGFPIIVEGRLRYREWTDQNNNKRSTYEIIVSRIHLLERKEQFIEEVEPPPESDELEKEKPSFQMNLDEEEISEEDIPF
jgi:single-strand DNA-binding protein